MEEKSSQLNKAGKPAIWPQTSYSNTSEATSLPPANLKLNTGSKKSKKPLIIGFVIVLFVILLGTGFAAYTHFNNKPEKVLADALTNMTSDLLEKKPSSTLSKLEYETKNKNPLKLAVTFDANNSGSDSEGSANVEVELSGAKYTVKSLAVIFGDDEIFFKLENLKTTAATLAKNHPEFVTYNQMLDPIISKIDNQWIRVTKDDLKTAGLTEEERIDKCTAALSAVKLSKADKKELNKIFRSNQFIVASETLQHETVSDEKSFHYKLDFNDKAAEGFAKQVIAMQSFAAVKKDCDIKDQDIADWFKEGSARVEDSKQTKPVIELWVGKTTRRPTKVRVSVDDKQASMDFATEVKLDTKNITIAKPKNSIPITELQAEIEMLMP